jgi:rhodanese-related sulfurtransferase
MRIIKRDELLALLADGSLTLIEALPKVQYQAEHLPGAVHAPGDLTLEVARCPAPDPSPTVVTYCSGPYRGRSTVAAAAFVHPSYTDVRVYTGGTADGADAGLSFKGSRATAKAA